MAEDAGNRAARRFGLTMAGLVAGVFGLAVPLLYGVDLPLWPWISASVLLLWTLVHPASLGPIRDGWMRMGLALGRVNAYGILGIAFFTVIVPAGIVMRLLRRDALNRRFVEQAGTYRKVAARRNDDDMEKPY